MREIIGYWVGFVMCILLHECFYDSDKECKQVDSVQMCRTVHYGDWKEQKE